jgi:hypothetical protein
MLTRIDHVMICVPDLQHGIDAYRRIGFNVSPGGVHPGKGTHNAIAFHEEDYLELMSVRDRDEYLSGNPGGGLLAFLAQGGGFRYVAVQSDDLVADVAQMRQRGVDVSNPSDGGRQTPTGQELRWRAATLGPRHPLPIFFIEHLTPLHERRQQASQAGTHPNGVTYKQLSVRIGLDLSVARRRAKDAQARGYLVNEETGRGRPAKLVLGDKLPEEQRLLPTVEELAAGMLARQAEDASTSPLLSDDVREEEL